MSYRIKTVSEMTGIPKNTLIAWERRYEFPKPERLPNGYRVYSDADLASLERIKGMLDEGYKISEALLLVERHDAGAEQAEPDVDAGQWSDLDRSRHDLFEAFLGFDQAEADRVFLHLGGLPYSHVVDDVLFPVLRQIGDAWARGDASIAQEHFAAGFCRERMMRMLMTLGSGPVNGRLVGCATFPGEQHELGLLGVAIHLALSGWRVAWLGANLPAPEVARFAAQTEPDMICVSLLKPVRRAELSDYARALRGSLEDGTRLVIGGAGTAGFAVDVEGVELIPSLADLDVA